MWWGSRRVGGDKHSYHYDTGDILPSNLRNEFVCDWYLEHFDSLTVTQEGVAPLVAVLDEQRQQFVVETFLNLGRIGLRQQRLWVNMNCKFSFCQSKCSLILTLEPRSRHFVQLGAMNYVTNTSTDSRFLGHLPVASGGPFSRPLGHLN